MGRRKGEELRVCGKRKRLGVKGGNREELQRINRKGRSYEGSSEGLQREKFLAWRNCKLYGII